MPSEHQLVDSPVAPITCHAWNKDRTKIAISDNSNDVVIYSYDGKTFKEEERLCEHTQTVTSIDWAPNTNAIVTAAQDRNAYVWNLVQDKPQSAPKWKPSLVILRINRAATCVKWSPSEKKFAVGSGARIVSICHFEEEHDWWVSKHIKKPIRSTILSLSWHPDNSLLAVGSCDFKCRIFSAVVKGADSKPVPNAWGDQGKFGNLVAEYSAGGWVRDVAFSHDGGSLAFVAHDASVYVAQPAGLKFLKTRHLAFSAVQWIRPTAFVCGGFDYIPFVYTFKGGEIAELGSMDKQEQKAEGEAKFSALAKFRNLDTRGTEDAAEVDTSVNATHQNAIHDLRLVKGTNADAVCFSTAGKDGKLVLWEVAEASRLGAL